MYDYKTGGERPDNFVDEQDKFDYFDYLSEVTYLNLKYYADKMNGIYFGPMDITDKTHKFLLHIALRVAIFNDEIKVHIPNLNKIKLWYFVWKEFGYKAIRYFNNKKLGAINAADLLEFESTNNKIPQSMFKEIYEAYYEKGGMIYAL